MPTAPQTLEQQITEFLRTNPNATVIQLHMLDTQGETPFLIDHNSRSLVRELVLDPARTETQKLKEGYVKKWEERYDKIKARYEWAFDGGPSTSWVAKIPWVGELDIVQKPRDKHKRKLLVEIEKALEEFKETGMDSDFMNILASRVDRSLQVARHIEGGLKKNEIPGYARPNDYRITEITPRRAELENAAGILQNMKNSNLGLKHRLRNAYNNIFDRHLEARERYYG